uniref:DH domain-containing protein n=1 Tax=Periophthalmus magnuspinnatus TaxID=409849 RepID=A0A3B4AAH5_9GOBI
MDLFRMRCYLASLQGGELPNPKSLLAIASRPTKTTLARLGIFSVSSFHALICSRDEATLRRRSLSLTCRQRKRGLFSSLKGLDNLTRRGREKRPSASQAPPTLCLLPPFSALLPPSYLCCSLQRLDILSSIYSMSPPEGGVWDSEADMVMCIYMPDSLTVQIPVRRDQTAADLLSLACKVGLQRGSRVGDQLEVVPINMFTLHMSKPSSAADFGSIFSASLPLLYSNLYCLPGLRPGDEILVLNGQCVSGLDLSLIQTLFSEPDLHLSLRRDIPELSPPFKSQKKDHFFGPVLNGLGCLLKQKLACLVEEISACLSCQRDAKEEERMVNMLSQHGEMASAPRGEATLLRPCPKHMSVTERLRKVIQELVDTEKSYVKDLTCLFEIYLKPLQRETFLTLDEMESLFGSLPEMLDFQRVFLQTLEERIASSPDFSTLETPSQFKKLLFSLGGSFLYYADHFKLYSGFCANHIKVQKVLERAKTDQAFKEFLDARNPTKQHSSTLESYLIKPVQRVLKYPLLLRELVSLTDADSEEHYHLSEALKAMEKVASHINEMQKIYEDYGAVFDQLVAEQSGHDKEVAEISMGEFLMHSSAVWLNPHPSLGRMRKDPEMTVFVFKKAVILVYRESNKLKKKMVSANPRLAHSHGDSDLFKFRWLIPLSALQVRLGNTAGKNSCIWELIHCRSEVEGRPETVFQLCSSMPESKVNIIKVIRSILRENVRRNMRCEGTLERNCKERLAPLRNTLPSSARLGKLCGFLRSSRASWRCKKPTGDFSQTGNTKAGPDSDEGSQSSGTYSLSSATPLSTPADTTSPPSQQSTHRAPASTSVKESDILSDEDDDGFSETRRDSGGSSSPASAIEAQFIQLQLSEEAILKCSAAPRVQPEGEGDTPEIQPKLKQGHSSAVRRKGSSVRRNRGALLNMKEHSRSLDSQTDTAPADHLNILLEREFSVQSLTSVVNEDCFYEQMENCAAECRNVMSS